MCAVYSAQQQINTYTNRQRRVARVSLNNIYNLKIMYYLSFFFTFKIFSNFSRNYGTLKQLCFVVVVVANKCLCDLCVYVFFFTK